MAYKGLVLMSAMNFIGMSIDCFPRRFLLIYLKPRTRDKFDATQPSSGLLIDLTIQSGSVRHVYATNQGPYRITPKSVDPQLVSNLSWKGFSSFEATKANIVAQCGAILGAITGISCFLSSER
jgi:hypothetical protein